MCGYTPSLLIDFSSDTCARHWGFESHVSGRLLLYYVGDICDDSRRRRRSHATRTRGIIGAATVDSGTLLGVWIVNRHDDGIVLLLAQ
jgi:hypothetical protein